MRQGSALSMVFVTLVAWAGNVSAAQYFPPGSVSDFEQQWYGKHLAAMHEPALGAPRAHPAKGVSELRVLVLPTWGHPVAVRYTFDAAGTNRRAIELCGKGGYAPGAIGSDRTATLAPAESAALLASLEASGYWSMPQDEQILGTDGTKVIVETVRDGEHRVRVRWTPESDSAERGLAGFVAFYSDATQRVGEVRCG